MEKTLAVSQLNNYIKGVFEDELILKQINVTGEISEYKTSAGTTYIVLKEGGCLLNCVAFSSQPNYQAGQKVCIGGSVRFHSKSGKLSFIIATIKLVGQGELLAALQLTKEKLAKGGVFSNSRLLPALVTRVALITSAEGAVLHDFMQTAIGLKYLNVTVFASKVQGDGASAEIIRILTEINDKIPHSFDAIVIARGGGSATDLSEFNSEPLARKVHESFIPVISAIGHEIDYTLCDFAADIRASTPTKAATIIKDNNRRFFNGLFTALQQIESLAARNLKEKLNMLSFFAEKISSRVTAKSQKNYNKSLFLSMKIHRYLEVLLEKNINRIKILNSGAFTGFNANLLCYQNRLNVLSATLKELDPQKILANGYAKIYKKESAISSAKQLMLGDNVEIVMSDGTVFATVDSNKG